MKTRGSLRSIAFVLALLTAFYALPMAAFASSGTDTAEGSGVSAGHASGNAAGGAATADASETVTSRQAVYVGELADLREANGKHFLYSDGTVRYALYEQDVHYLDTEGVWQDIDNALSPALTEDGGLTPRGLFSIPAYRYEVVNGDTSYSFAPRSSDTALLRLSFGAYGASFALLGAEDSVAVLGEEAEPSEDPAVLPALRSSITYGDVLTDTDLTYILVGTSLYEHITVKAKGEDPYAYTFRMETEGLVPTLTEDGAVTLSAPSGEAVYTVPPSYMVDAAGEGSTAVAYTLTQISDSVWHLTITADSAWINDPSRVYPVVIDPPVEISGFAWTLDTYISSADAGNASAEGYANTGYPD